MKKFKRLCPRWVCRFSAMSSLVFGLTSLMHAAQVNFRTDINPALLYFQAYQNMPQLTEEDTRYLFDHPGAWPENIDDRAKGLLRQYDNSFKGLRRARYSQVPCDWGYDLSDGPEALLPGLAPAKRLSQVARLRAMAALDEKDFEGAKEAITSAYVLGRNLSKDNILISALVQDAIENILTSVVMENYHRLTAKQLKQLVEAFDNAPARGTIAQTIPTENNAFYRYIVRKVNDNRNQPRGSGTLLGKIRGVLGPDCDGFRSKQRTRTERRRSAASSEGPAERIDETAR